LYGEAGSRRGGEATSTQSLMSKQAIGEGGWGKGGVRVEGNRQRQGRAKQRNETYLTYILAHFTRTVVIKAQGASTSYFFSSIKLYKIVLIAAQSDIGFISPSHGIHVYFFIKKKRKEKKLLYKLTY